MRILFTGDSITEGFDLKKHLSEYNCINHGNSGTSSEELLNLINPVWFEEPYQKVLLCIGTNDLTRNIAHDVILSNIKKITIRITELNGFKPEIYIQSIFPVRNLDFKTNEGIDHFNLALHQRCIEWQIPFLYLNPYFKDNSGRMQSQFTDDGLHLTDKAYTLWSYLLKAII